VVPVQVPGDAVSVRPSCVVPATEGAAVFDGACPETTAVCADSAVAEPAPFVAVTATRIVEPTSLEAIA